jgi:hypothetical protein
MLGTLLDRVRNKGVVISGKEFPIIVDPGFCRPKKFLGNWHIG